jgi:alkaline phosphatase
LNQSLKTEQQVLSLLTQLTGGTITGGVQALSGAGAADLTNLVTELTTAAGAAAVTLANGTTAGQIKIITMVVDGGGTATVTPATFANGTSMAFADVNDTVMLVWANTIGWVIVSNSGAVVS